MENSSFSAGLEITGIDSVGLVSKITDIISKELKINMNSVSFSATDGTFIGNVVLNVDGKNHLSKLIDKIKGIDPYLNVIRTDVN
jgi:guanosine-3',5'-bis(diphosphate) 3'-pyrophosphohydrolase